MYGKNHKESSRKKMSDYRKSLSSEQNPMYGKNQTEEAKQKIRETKKDRTFMTNGINTYLVHNNQVQEYLNNGYYFGRKKYNINKQNV